MTVAEEPAEPRPAVDGTVRTRWGEPVRRNQPIVKALVIPFPVVMATNAVGVRRTQHGGTGALRRAAREDRVSEARASGAALS
jgi:hypothetical protein